MHTRALLALTAMAFGLATAHAQQPPRERQEQGQSQRAAPREGPSMGARQAQGGPPAANRASPRATQRAEPGRHAGPGQAAGPDYGRSPDRGAGADRGAGPDRRFHAGDRLPTDYRHRQYRVDDWRNHGLGAPPRGHQWVQVGTDYVLIAIATGIITQIILDH